jgi:hypothetical protein
MQNSEITAVTLGTIVLAGSFLSEVAPQGGGWIPLLGGVVLLLILFSYDREGTRTGWQSIAFGGVAGMCAAIATAPFVGSLLSSFAGLGISSRAILWLLAGVIFSLVDRARMGRRVAQPSSAGPANLSFSPPAVPVRPSVPEAAPSFTAQRRTATSISPFAPGAPVTPTPPVAAAPASTPFVYAPEPTSVPEPDPVSIAPPIPEPGDADRYQPAPVQAPPPNAVAIQTGAGKPATIYLNLLDQGIACLRTVQAEHLGRDFYRIVESEPEGETWEFHPGQVVRCRKQKLSNGKGLVAFEEAPRAS